MIRGSKHTLQAKQMMRKRKLENPTRYWLGKTPPRLSKKARKIISETHKGHPSYQTEESKKKISTTLKEKFTTGVLISPLRTMGWIGRRGENAANWRGGKTALAVRLRQRKDYQEWRKSVLERDDKKCVLCSSENNLHVDHILSFANYPTLRLNTDNGRTLCKPCHLKTPNYGGRKATV